MAKLLRRRRRDRVEERPVEASAPDAADDAVPVADEQLDAELGREVGGAPGTGAGTGSGTGSVETEDVVGDADGEVVEDEGRRRGLALAVRHSQPVLLLEAAHPRQVLLTGTFLGIAALASERPPREAAAVAATALVGQAILGWHNDLVDRRRDARHGTPRKPVADGRLDPGSAWYALVVGVLLVVPLSISTGVTAGSFYLAALAVGLLGNVVLRRGKLSFVSWAAQFALYAPYLSFGGWGGGADGQPPEPAMVALFALLGVGVHVLRAIWGLVADDADRWTYLPLVLGRRMGATRLLAVAATYTAVVVAAVVVVGSTTGLRR